MNLHVEPPDKRKKTTKNSSTYSFSLFPEEIAVNCLARISRSYYPALSIVSKSFRSLLSSTELYATRSHLGLTEQCIYVCLWDSSYQFPQWSTLWINPNRTLPDSMISEKKTTGQLLVPINSSDFPSVSKSVVAFDSEVYVIGGPLVVTPYPSLSSHNSRRGIVGGAASSAVFVLDCRSHTWRDAPSMNVARKKALACVYDGKIYVIGGCKGSEDKSFAEVFDRKTQTWEPLPDPSAEIRNCKAKSIAEIEGKIHFGYGNKMYAYDPKQGKWEQSEGLLATFPKSECVMENVSYCYGRFGYGSYGCWWYDIKGDIWKEVKGIESLGAKYKMNGGAIGHRAKVVSCGGKLFVFWIGYMRDRKHNTKIWCAEIELKRHGVEICGNVEWIDVVHTVPASCRLLQCLTVLI